MIYYYNGLKIQTPYTIVSNQQAFENESLSLKRTTFLTGAQRWELSFSVVTNGNEGDIFAAHAWDYYKKKSMIMPQLPGVVNLFSFNGVLTGTVNNPAGSETVYLTSSAQTGTATIPEGTFIKFSSHDKVYAVRTTISFSNGTTNIPLDIFPALSAPVLTSDTAQYSGNCLITYKLDLTSGRGISVSNGFISNPGTIKLVEAL